MSGITATKPANLLPEDIENKLSMIQKLISDLTEERRVIELDTESKRIVLAQLTKKVEDINTEYDTILGSIEYKKKLLDDKENQLAQKEADLNFYSNFQKSKLTNK
jgi:chromosome segregation ATPase